MVDHVRDRAVADVHILITGQSTGAGGSEVTLTFLGLGPFDRANDLLRYTSPPSSSGDAIRKGLLQKIRLGLVRYVSHSETADALQVSIGPSSGAGTRAATRDPWDHWVMRVRFNGNMNGEAASSYRSFSGGASANRVTEAWKISLSGSASYSESSYDLGDDSWYTSISRSSSLSGLAAKSVSPRWSAGLRATAGSSTYTNKKLYATIMPAVEYNIFPYAESTRRSITFQYSVGASTFRYRDVTLYDRTAETLPTHALLIDGEARQPWGQVSVGVDLSQYLNKLDTYRVESFGIIDLRVKKGLSLNLGGGAGWIHDQIYLPKGAATTEEILVRQRQLKTSYSYSMYFGISYTFGSIFNNIVNPRFGSSSGGATMVMYY